MWCHHAIQNLAQESLMRNFIVWVVLLVVGLLGGFVPQYLKARRLNEELSSCTAKAELAQVRQSGALTYISATQLNYGVAAGYAQTFFADVQKLQGTTSDASLRDLLTQISSSRDKITADLARGSSDAIGELQPLVLKLQQAGQ
jgi:hypothetical protein